MSLSKVISAENKITFSEPSRDDLRYILSNLKAEDKKKTANDLRYVLKTENQLIDIWEKESVLKRLVKYNGNILFAFGLLKLKDNFGYSLWWEPTELCGKLKKTYGRASLMAADILKKENKSIWTCTPKWYTQNIRATEHLGFSKVGEFLMYDEEYILFKMEK